MGSTKHSSSTIVFKGRDPEEHETCVSKGGKNPCANPPVIEASCKDGVSIICCKEETCMAAAASLARTMAEKLTKIYARE
jgi:hypothetical protein